MKTFRPIQDGEENRFAHLTGPIALYVGRVAIEKNIEAFLDMDWSGTKVVIGGGPALEELKERYEDIEFLGIKTGEDLGSYFRSADIFAFPSKTDTFGIVLIEALASGLPVAGYNVTGPKDIITQDILGATHEDDLSKACRRALKAPGTAQDRADYVQRTFSWDTMAQQFLEATFQSSQANL